MPKVFSITSLQSGVGKSYVTAALADFLSGATNKRVLVIDLGVGGAVTAMLIGWDRQNEISEENTVVRLIQDQLDPEDMRFHFDKVVQHGVSNVRQAPTIDLLGGRSDYPVNQHIPPDSVNSTDLLRRAVESNLGNYDVVLIDCPSGVPGLLTCNALRISDGCIIPGLSHFNLLSGTTSILDIGTILHRVNKFAVEIVKDIRLHGIVFNRHRRQRCPYAEEQLWTAGIGSMWGRPPIAYVPEKFPFPLCATSKLEVHKTLRQKWGDRLTKTFTKFANDILRFEGAISDF